MIETFTNGKYKYTLASPTVVLSRVKINGVDISKYLTDATTISWYDVSRNSGRETTTASGKMILNVISTKYRLDLQTRPLTSDEMIDFFAQIIKKPTMSVQFLNPFTGSWKTISCYRGDRSAKTLLPYEKRGNLVELFEGVSKAENIKFSNP